MTERLTDAEQWELLIPHLGYMALIRNLRNFDEAGVSSTVKDSVCARIENPEEVARSRQFPYRFLSSYKAAPSLDWGKSLSRALDLSCQNIPEMPGRSLVLIDTSGSMSNAVSDRSQVRFFEVGALFAAVLSKRAEKVDTVIFGDTSAPFSVKPGESVLQYVKRVAAANGKVGHGTAIWKSVVENYNGHDRVVIFTDMQSMDGAGNPQEWSGYYSRTQATTYNVAHIPFIHSFNLAGYKVTGLPKKPGRWEYGGFNDSSFVLMPALENGGI